MKIISGFNSTIPSVRKVRNWLLNDPNHMWIGRDRLVVFFILAGDEAANAFLPLEEVDYSMQDENIRAVLESTHLEEKEKRQYYQQVYYKLNSILNSLDDLNLQLTAMSKEDDIDYYTVLEQNVQVQHGKLMNFINDVFVWRDQKEMGALLGDIPPVAIEDE